MEYRFLYLLVGFAGLAKAHFVFVVPQPGAATAHVILSETLLPSDEVDVGLIAKTSLSLRDLSGAETRLVLEKADHAYVITLPGAGTRLIHGSIDLGLQERQGKSFLLVYYPKTVVGNAFEAKAAVGSSAPVEIVPDGKPGALRLKVLAHGKPQPDSEVTIILPDGTQKKLKTDGGGLTETLTETGRFGAWARYWEALGGEREGKQYTETRNYATLVFDAQAETASSSGATSQATAARFATLPQATSSFGAVVSI